MAEFNQNENIFSSIVHDINFYEDIPDKYVDYIRYLYFPDEYEEIRSIKYELTKKEIDKIKKARLYIFFYGYPEYNYCKKFKLEDIIEEKSFNKEFNTDALRWVLWKKFDMTLSFIRSIKRRVKNQSNIIIFLSGTPNSGKSEVAQTIAKFIQYLFKRLYKKDVQIFIAFSTADFNVIIPEMKIGDISIRDESPELSGKGSRTVKKNLDNITRIIRMNQNSFIFVNPTELDVDVVSFYLEMKGKYVDGRMSRCILKDKNKNVVGHIYVPLHNDKKLRGEYLKLKKENIKNTMDNSGQFGVKLDKKRFMKDLKFILDYCKEHDIYTRSEIDAEIFIHSDKITGDGIYTDALASKAFGEMKKYRKGIENDEMFTLIEEKIDEEDKQEKIIEFPFEINEGMPFHEYVFKSLKGKMAAVGEAFAKGKTYDWILKKNPDITLHDILKIKERLIKKHNMGFLFEDWFALIKLKVPKEFLHELVAHNVSVPDIIWEDKIYSLKYINEDKRKTHTLYQSTDLRPEYNEAIKRKCNYFLVVLNPKWNLNLLIKEINPFTDADKIVCKPNRIITLKP